MAENCLSQFRQLGHGFLDSMKIKLQPPKDKPDNTISEYWRTIAQEEGVKRMELVHKEVEDSKKLPRFSNKDFYVCLFMNRDRSAKVKKSYYRTFSRISCPTPHYSMGVWKYHHVSGELEFLWMVPAKPKAYHLAQQYPHVLSHEHSLAYYSILALNGTLLQFAEQENGHKENALIIHTPAHA